MASMVLPAEMEYIETLLDFVAGEAQESEFSTRRVSEIRLAAEEILVNIVNYAYPESGGDVLVRCHSEKEAFVLEIVDDGRSFNILEAPGPDVSSSLWERDVGGLGIYFAKKMASNITYARIERQNRLKLAFRKHRQNLQERKS